MAIADMLLPEFDHETALTRTTIAALPADQLEWKPREDKASTAIGLVSHLVEIPLWAVNTLTETSFDFAPKDGAMWQTPAMASVDHALNTWDSQVADARSALQNISDEAFMVEWSLLNGGTPVMTMPRIACYRGFIMNHMIHHRAQLSLYLRLMGAVPPSIYGPTFEGMADMMGAG